MKLYTRNETCLLFNLFVCITDTYSKTQSKANIYGQDKRK